jgi:alpha-glucosidase
MRAIADEYGARRADRRDLPAGRSLMDYYGAAGPGVHLPFNFQLIDAPTGTRAASRR